MVYICVNIVYHYHKKNNAFACSLDRIAEDGYDFWGIVNAGEGLQAMFTFFDGFFHSEFENLIELSRLKQTPEEFTSEEQDYLIDNAMGHSDINFTEK